MRPPDPRTGFGDGPGQAAPPPFDSIHQRVYEALRTRLLGGQILPGKALSLRKIAADLGVSPMPVRAALNRLIAERALEMRSNRRVYVPEMSGARFAELVSARAQLEPEAARLALPALPHGIADTLAAIDDEIDESLRNGDVEGYVTVNRRFHFTIYRGNRAGVLVPLIESVWLQFSPFMRTVYGRVGTTTLTDYHREAVKAAKARDAQGFADAIRADIMQGMNHIGSGVLSGIFAEAADGPVDSAHL
ncbi:MAG: GntR family transcriptional regulator [Flavobacteriaceae bacterium]